MSAESAIASEAVELPADVLGSSLYNHDLAPTSPARRTWNRWHIAALWVGMAICVPTYTLAAGLLKSGMNWWQAVGTILLGNLIVLVPMCLNAHPGAKYGIPFPVLIRSSFGTTGSNVPAIARAIVACGWFGIQTWFGGAAIYQLLLVFFPHWRDLPPLAFLGDPAVNAAELACFLAFWLVNVWFIVKGTESIKWLEALSAPFLIAVGIALLAWAAQAGGGLGRVLSESERFRAPTVAIEADGDVALRPLEHATRYRLDGGPWRELTRGATERMRPESPEAAKKLKLEFAGKDEKAVSSALAPAPAPDVSFLALFLPALTAMVGYWATLSLNIPDFTRFAKSQKDQVLGQLIGLPTTMAFYSFVGIAATCAALVAFPDVYVHEDAPWDPPKLLGRFTAPPLVITSMIGLLVATLSTNIAANVVSPANDFANVAPRYVGFVGGGLITAVIGILMMPWKLIATTQGYIFTWLIGYGALLGPIAGIMIADYFVVRRRELDVADLYRENGRYGRWNGLAIGILAVAVAPCVPGFLAEAFPAAFAASVPAALKQLYTYAWFVGFTIAFILYAALAKREGKIA